MLTLTNLSQSIPQLLNTLEVFSKYSGYKINCNKSEAIPLNRLTFSSHLGTAPFVWKYEGMKYLRITIKSPITKIFELNGPKIVKTIKEDIKRWTALPLNLWGRAEVIKMYLLPRLTFPISAIPLKIPQKWFKEIDTLFSHFLWRGKKPRISRKKLTMP